MREIQTEHGKHRRCWKSIRPPRKQRMVPRLVLGNREQQADKCAFIPVPSRNAINIIHAIFLRYVRYISNLKIVRPTAPHLVFLNHSFSAQRPSAFNFPSLHYVAVAPLPFAPCNPVPPPPLSLRLGSNTSPRAILPFCSCTPDNMSSSSSSSPGASARSSSSIS